MRLRILLLLAGISALTVTCSKPAASSGGDSKLSGTWIATHYLISPGPVGTWKDWHDGAYVAIFHEDGRLELTKPFLSLQHDRYEVIDKNTIRLYTSATNDSTEIRYDLSNKQLTLWLFCIEPCGIRFARPQK